MKEIEKYGLGLRHVLHQKRMSAEELVVLMNEFAEISTNKSAISRIMTGKRMPSLEEATRLSQVLEAPELLTAFQHLQEFSKTDAPLHALAFHESVDQLLRVDAEVSAEHVMEQPKIDYGLLYQMIETQYQYCLNQDISVPIKESFITKIRNVRGFGDMIRNLQTMYQCFFHNKNIRMKDRTWLGVALLYFITPMDLIPDYFFPYGYVDDALVVGFVAYKLGDLLKQFSEKELTPIQSYPAKIIDITRR